MDALYQTDTIRIRPYTEGDDELLLECVLDSLIDFQRFLPWVHENYCIDDSRQWLEWTQINWQQGTQFDLVVERISDEKFLGGVGLLNVNPYLHSAHLGYFIRSDEAGQGYSTQAAQLAQRFAAKELGVTQLDIFVATDNLASLRVVEKLGGTYIERLEQHEVVNGRWLDSEHYLLVC